MLLMMAIDDSMPYNVRVTRDHGKVRRERSDRADALGRRC